MRRSDNMLNHEFSNYRTSCALNFGQGGKIARHLSWYQHFHGSGVSDACTGSPLLFRSSTRQGLSILGTRFVGAPRVPSCAARHQTVSVSKKHALLTFPTSTPENGFSCNKQSLPSPRQLHINNQHKLSLKDLGSTQDTTFFLHRPLPSI